MVFVGGRNVAGEGLAGGDDSLSVILIDDLGFSVNWFRCDPVFEEVDEFKYPWDFGEIFLCDTDEERNVPL